MVKECAELFAGGGEMQALDIDVVLYGRPALFLGGARNLPDAAPEDGAVQLLLRAEGLLDVRHPHERRAPGHVVPPEHAAHQDLPHLRKRRVHLVVRDAGRQVLHVEVFVRIRLRPVPRRGPAAGLPDPADCWPITLAALAAVPALAALREPPAAAALAAVVVRELHDPVGALQAVQGRDRAPRGRDRVELDEAVVLASVLVLHDDARLHGPVAAEDLFQLIIGYVRVEVPDEDVAVRHRLLQARWACVVVREPHKPA
mmetsp:Transcript_36106/g.101639  ORF Transcript_36106/g.101639 Transcript_36106/m.101639 type:complete len:258 (+) Transcript_36106:984-1757(+)